MAVDAPLRGGPPMLLPGHLEHLSQQVFGGTSVGETSWKIYNVASVRELIVLARVTGLAGTPTVTVRVYKTDEAGNRYPATQGTAGAAAALKTLTFTANSRGYISIGLAAGDIALGGNVGLGKFLEITFEYAIGGVTPVATLNGEVDSK